MDTALFFSLTGRARRLHWWAGMAAMFVVVAIIQVAASLLGLGPWGLGRQVTGDAQALVDAHNATAWYGIALMLLFAWPYFALAIKRRHDRGSSGLDVTIFVAFLALLQLWRGTRIGFSAAEIPQQVRQRA